MTVLVLDVGKTHAKISAWSREGDALGSAQRVNRRGSGAGARLDMDGIADWFAPTARALVERHGPVSGFIPVGHGAAAALIGEDGGCRAPRDYEAPIAREVDGRYEAARDGFDITGSPSLNAGLNLGRQLMAEQAEGRWPEGGQIVPWPQVWAWRLTGERTSEVTGLGCHTDLWSPWTGGPSPLARSMGWDRRLAPLRYAGAVVGIAAGPAARAAGLEGVAVHCGLHDSNAALWGARALPFDGAASATVLSTGTWFVAMRALAEGETGQALALGPDDLINVDVEGRPTPSARFMGGRWSDARLGELRRRLFEPAFQPAICEAAVRQLEGEAPTGESDDAERLARVAVSLAQEAAAMLARIGSRGPVVIDGIFGRSEAFVRALAALRAEQAVLTVGGLDLVGVGAVRLARPGLTVSLAPIRAAPLTSSAVAAGGARAQAATPS